MLFGKRELQRCFPGKVMVPKNKFFKRLKCEKTVPVCEEFDL